MAKRWALPQYIDALRRIRPYTKGFDAKSGYDIRQAENWTPAQKGSIRRYAEMLQTLQASQYTYLRRFRNKKIRQAVKNAMGVGSFSKLISVPIESKPERFDEKTGLPILIRPQIKVRSDGTVETKLNGITRDTINIFEWGYTREQLAEFPVQIFEEILNDIDYKYYSIITGEHEYTAKTGVPKTFRKKAEVLAFIEQFVRDYGKDTDKAKEGHYYVDWMHGLKGFKFNVLKDLLDWKAGREAFVRNRRKVSKQIKSSKEIIEKHQEDLAEINKARNLYKKISNFIYAALREMEKSTKSKRQLARIQKARDLTKANKNKKIPRDLRKFIVDFKKAQIEKQYIRINDLRQNRSRSFS